jgi:hypothetical protein
MEANWNLGPEMLRASTERSPPSARRRQEVLQILQNAEIARTKRVRTARTPA